MFRVYDIEENKWVKDKCFMDSKENLHIANKTFLGNVKLNLVSSEKYIYQYSIGLDDVNGNPIYEGDICKSNNKNSESENIIGIISYYPDFASYVILDYNTKKYYVLSKYNCSNNLKIIGNVFDNPNMFKEN